MRKWSYFKNKMMTYSIKCSAMILILLLSQIRVFSWRYKTPDSTIHVFLSFRGADIRQSMAPLLHSALFRAGFNVFMDERSIRLGKDIDPNIKQAIEKSMGSVIIFSRDFASSEWCLNELLLIMRQRELRSNYVLVAIYMDGVQPDDIGEEGGSYGKALAKHKNRLPFWSNKDKEWRAAFRQVEGCRGIKMDRNMKWDKLIDEVIEDLQQEFSLLGIEVNPRPAPSGEHPAEGLSILYKLLEDLGIIGNLIPQNQRQFNLISTKSSIQHQQHHDHDQSVESKKNVVVEKRSRSEWDWFNSWECAICVIMTIYFRLAARNQRTKDFITSLMLLVAMSSYLGII